jgi:purine-binding chemotaxis protein CheW
MIRRENPADDLGAPAMRLAEPQLALANYLEALLAEKPAHLPVPAAPKTVAVPEVITAEKSAVEVRAPVEIEEAVTVAPVAVKPAPVVAPPVAITKPAVEMAVAPAVKSDPVPAWAQQPFPVLFLTVAGLNFALPLTRLQRILPWEEPTPLPGFPDWYKGVLPQPERRVHVVDTRAFVMPERLPAEGEVMAAPNHIVIVEGGQWGLTCDSVSEVKTLDPAKVKWRGGQGKRPWLAGTAVEQLCAILDVEQLAELLNQGLKSPD